MNGPQYREKEKDESIANYLKAKEIFLAEQDAPFRNFCLEQGITLINNGLFGTYIIEGLNKTKKIALEKLVGKPNIKSDILMRTMTQ